MKDAECVETNEKLVSRFFAIFRFWDIVIFVLKIGNFWWNSTMTRKIKIWKNWKLIFLSIKHIPHFSCKYGYFSGGGGSAYSFFATGPTKRSGREFSYILDGKRLNFRLTDNRNDVLCEFEICVKSICSLVLKERIFNLMHNTGNTNISMIEY